MVPCYWHEAGAKREKMRLATKRIYDPPAKEDGFRILVDRLWPRGIKKERAAVAEWLKDIAPSDALRKWFSHDPGKWPEFRRRYFEELENKDEMIDLILDKERHGAVTLLYGAKEEKVNNAVALKEYIEAKMKKAK